MWVATIGLYRANRRQITHAENTAVKELRAYVYVKLTSVRYPFPPKIADRIGIGFEMRNGGKTWAKNLIAKKAVIPREYGVEYDPWSRADWQSGEEYMTLGPEQSLGLQLTAIALTDLPKIMGQELGFDFAVWISYEDTFSDPPVVRQTRLLQRLNTDPDGGTSFAYLPKHNCADDDCPKD
jgi:hypothetical protein